MITEGSKHLIHDEKFGLIMNPAHILLISIFHTSSPQALVASYATTLLVCHTGVR